MSAAQVPPTPGQDCDASSDHGHTDQTMNQPWKSLGGTSRCNHCRSEQLAAGVRIADEPPEERHLRSEARCSRSFRTGGLNESYSVLPTRFRKWYTEIQREFRSVLLAGAAPCLSEYLTMV